MTPTSFLWIIIVLAAVALDWALLRWLRRGRGAVKPIMPRPRFGRAGAALLELGLLTAWVLWLGRNVLVFSPTIWLHGREFIMGAQAHYSWDLLRQCGACFLWNGFTNGGAPAFVDLHSAWLHPAVALPALWLGVIDGAKVSVVLGLLLAGLGQWWLARALGLGGVARVWSAALAAAGGHLAAKLDIGSVALVLSTAAGSLVLAGAVDLALHGGRRRAVALGAAAALALLAGQGYVQLALVVAILPALLLVVTDDRAHLRAAARHFALAGLLAVLLAAALLAPVAHFWPDLNRFTDASFASAQPLAYVPLNLVLSEAALYDTTALGKLPYAYLYPAYVGWVPVLLALLAAWRVPRDRRRLFWFFVVALALVFCASSGWLFQAPARLWPTAGLAIRNPALMLGLAVPLVLGLAAWALDRLLPRVLRRLGRWPWLAAGLGLAALLIWSLASAVRFGANWLYTEPGPTNTSPVARRLVTATTEWVQTPDDNYDWLAAARAAGLKVAVYFRPWEWRGRPFPPPYRAATLGADDPPGSVEVGQVDQYRLLAYPANEYAYVEGAEGRTICQAHAQGGDIEVTCAPAVAGWLIVRENQWTGWQAARDGQAVPLGPDPQWLSVWAEAGPHTYSFRYRPWDVPVGAALSVVGLALAVGLWVYPGRRKGGRRKEQLAAGTKQSAESGDVK